MNARLWYLVLALLPPGLPPIHAQLDRSSDQALTVATESGRVSGVAMGKNVTVFRGIPYAAPPTGPLRWQPPTPPAAWEGVRQCREFGAMAVQTDNPDIGSEDCLYLNIWTSGALGDQQLPVMVWIHGGGLANGSGHEPEYDGVHFARGGVVLVTINYRLGALGFFSHPQLSAESKRGVSGNYGLLDQLAALKWVQNNISNFGGDPNNVTVFGESAGGTSVYVLIASPLAKGLFHRAILQSPWLDDKVFRHLKKDTFAGQSAESANADRASGLIDAASTDAASTDADDEPLATLRRLSAQQVTANLGRDQPVVVDDWLLPDFPQRIYAAGKQNQVASLAGTNRDEGSLFVARQGIKTVADFTRSVKDEFGDQADAVLDFYGVKKDSDVRQAVIQKLTDVWFVYPTRTYCNAMAAQENPTWMYQFNRRSTTRPYLGATHGAEIPFVFNTLGPQQKVGVNKALAELMQQLWINFASTGNPNAGQVRGWSYYSAEDDRYLVIAPQLSLGSGLRDEACELYDSVFAKLRSPAQE